MRIAGDLQAAIAGGLREIAANADAAPGPPASRRPHGRTSPARPHRDHRPRGARRRPPRARHPAPRGPTAPPRPSHRHLDGARSAAAAAARQRGCARARPPRPRAAHPRSLPRHVDRVLAAAVLVGVALELALVAPAGEWLVAALAGVLIAAAAAVAPPLPAARVRRRPRRRCAPERAGRPRRRSRSPTSPRWCAPRTRSRVRRPRVQPSPGSFWRSPARPRTRRSSIPTAWWRRCSAGSAAPWTLGRVIRAHRGLTRQGREEAARAERERVARRRPRSRASGCASPASCTTRSRTTSA